jgi:hypothetical protein
VSATVFPDIPERVARGVALLDEKCPGWDQKINVKALDIEDPANCVIGQVYKDSGIVGAFGIGATNLVGKKAYGNDINAPVLIEHGFSGTRRPGDDNEFDALTAAWKRAIRARRAAAPAEPPAREEA